jgi:hypothetical protein
MMRYANFALVRGGWVRQRSGLKGVFELWVVQKYVYVVYRSPELKD